MALSALPSSRARVAEDKSAAREPHGTARSATPPSARTARRRLDTGTKNFDVNGFKQCMDELFDRLDRHSIREIDLAGCAFHRRADKLVIDDLVDEVDGALSVQGLARNAEHVIVLRGGDPDRDVGIRQQVAARVIDRDEALPDVARAVGDDRGWSLLYMALPNEVRLGLPGNRHRLPGGQLADLRFVEVGAYLELRQIGHVNQRLPRLDEVILRNRQRIDCAGKRGVDIDVRVAALRGGETGARLRDLCALCGEIDRAIAVVDSFLDLRDLCLRGVELLLS